MILSSNGISWLSKRYNNNKGYGYFSFVHFFFKRLDFNDMILSPFDDILRLKVLEILLINNLLSFLGFDFWDPFKSKYNCTLF